LREAIMTKKLGDIDPTASVVVRGANALTDRPALALKIALIMNAWAMVESELGILLSVLLGANAETIVNVYNALNSWFQQCKVVVAAGEAVLEADDLELLQAILRVANTLIEKRNKIAHATWAATPSVPDGLVLWRVKAGTSNFAKTQSMQEKQSRAFSQQDISTALQHRDDITNSYLKTARNFEVYRAADFDRLVRKLESLDDWIFKFQFSLSAEYRKEMRQKLRTVAAIRVEIERLHKARQSQSK
jgi:hypothetical protein